MDLDSQWEQFMNEDFDINNMENMKMFNNSSTIDNIETTIKKEAPLCSELNISTKSKIIYLNKTCSI